MSECANPRCKTTVRTGQLACRTHWFELPKPLRDAIWSTWKDRERDGLAPWSANVQEARKFWAQGGDEPPVLPGLDEHRRVVRAALTAVVTVPHYVLTAPDDALWVLTRQPPDWIGGGQVSTREIKALREVLASAPAGGVS